MTALSAQKRGRGEKWVIISPHAPLDAASSFPLSAHKSDDSGGDPKQRPEKRQARHRRTLEASSNPRKKEEPQEKMEMRYKSVCVCKFFKDLATI